MNTIRDYWESFEAGVVPAQASEAQRADMERAFYAGAVALMALLEVIASMSEDAGVLMLESLREETRIFVAQRAGK